MKQTLLMPFAACLGAICFAVDALPPAPYGPVPTEHQLNWQRLEYYAFVHFGLNTWTGQEWGYGNADPKLFNPADFNADAMCELFKEGGMSGLIFVAKHHDGFCLWPTATTDYNITLSPWNQGQGNVVKEVADACVKHGINLGLYVSPWDRNHAEYGREGYLQTLRAQITELATQFGPIFEFWFDGANEGTGYYGGANETRNITFDYYRWAETVTMLRELQPQAILWNLDNLGDARWGGSEKGHVAYPHWNTLTSKERTPEKDYPTGIPHGDVWVPAEGDAPIRDGWFTHDRFDHTVRSPEHLLQVWLDCVGRGANFLLNISPNKTGRIHPADAEALLDFRALRDRMYAFDYALGATCSSEHVRGNAASFSPQNLVDEDIESYWTCDEGVENPSVIIKLPEARSFDLVRVREQIRLGQRVDSFTVEAMLNGEWKLIIDGKTIGNQVILPTIGGPVSADQLRLTITGSPAVPCISEFSLLRRPSFIPKPIIERKGNLVQMSHASQDAGLEIRYTLDGTEPQSTSPRYEAPLSISSGVRLQARIYNEAGEAGRSTQANLPSSKAEWKMLETSSTAGQEGKLAFDDNPHTIWHTQAADGEQDVPQHFVVDMGKELVPTAFSYLPRQDGHRHGVVLNYKFELSLDGLQWEPAAEGEFSNIGASPIEYIVSLDAALRKPARYFRFTATRVVEKNHVTVGEISIYTED